MNYKSLSAPVDRWMWDYKVRRFIAQNFKDANIERNVIIKGPLTNLNLGEKANIHSGTVLHLGGMSWCEGKGFFEMGDNGVIGPNSTVFAVGSGGVRIGRNFDCGPGVGIFAARTDYEKGVGHHIFKPVIIGDNVIVYANAVISPGVTIGSGAVIAACSTVIRDVPANALVGGSPARIIRMLNRQPPSSVIGGRIPLIHSPAELLCLQE